MDSANRIDYIKSDLLNSFLPEGTTSTLTLLRNYPVVSGDLTQRSCLPTSVVSVASHASRPYEEVSGLSQAAKESKWKKTARECAVERLGNVVKCDRANSLSAGSRQLSKLKHFF